MRICRDNVDQQPSFEKTICGMQLLQASTIAGWAPFQVPRRMDDELHTKLLER